jgi:hypothetical protein
MVPVDSLIAELASACGLGHEEVLLQSSAPDNSRRQLLMRSRVELALGSALPDGYALVPPHEHAHRWLETTTTGADAEYSQTADYLGTIFANGDEPLLWIRYVFNIFAGGTR